MKDKILSILGWIGTSLILIAYALLSTGIIESDSLIYQLINFSGALALGLNLFPKKAYAALFLQISWGFIAIVGIVMILI